jgi:hypothetical protein
MSKSLFLTCILLFSLPLAAKKKSTPKAVDFSDVTARGRMLAEYLTALGQARKAVLALHPPAMTLTHDAAQKGESGWVVVFGRYNEARDRFLITYEATPGTTPDEFAVKQLDPPREDAGFFLLAAKAMDTAGADFRGAKLRYDVAVLPAESGQVYVYFLPAQTSPGVYIYGGDFRYLVSSDGTRIVEKRRLHKSVLKSGPGGIPAGATVAGGYHTHVLSDVPEDTDVAMVLLRRPLVPEFIGTRNGSYKVKEDGTIVRSK